MRWAERTFLSNWISLYFVMQSCGVFSALLRNWDIDERVNVLKQWDIHRSLCFLNHKHLSLPCYRNVSTVLFEILLGYGRLARRTISRLSSAAGLTAIIHLLHAERIHHDLLDLLRRCFSAVWTVCVLILHGFLVEADVWDGRDHFAKLQLVLPLLDIWDWLAAAFLCTVLLLVLRLVSVRSPLVRFACRWLCSSLASVGSDLVLPAVGSDLVLPAFGVALVLPAVGFALLPAVGFAFLPAVGFAVCLLLALLFCLLLVLLFCLLLVLLFSVLFSVAPDL